MVLVNQWDLLILVIFSIDELKIILAIAFLDHAKLCYRIEEFKELQLENIEGSR